MLLLADQHPLAGQNVRAIDDPLFEEGLAGQLRAYQRLRVGVCGLNGALDGHVRCSSFVAGQAKQVLTALVLIIKST